MTCLMAFPNRIDEATLSGGSWEAALPLTNLQNRVYSKVARSTDADEASTKISIDLGVIKPLRVAAADGHNFSITAKWRIRLYADAGHTELIEDSGLQNVFTVLYTEETETWDSGNLWDLTLDETQLDGLRMLALYIWEESRWARYVLIEFFDEENEDGYVQAGRLFLGDGFVPTWNMSYGNTIGYEDRDEVDEAKSGAEYFNPLPAPRVARFTLDALTETEAMSLLDMQRILGSTGELLFIWSTDDTLHLLRRSFLARMRRLSPLERARALINKAAFEIKEQL